MPQMQVASIDGKPRDAETLAPLRLELSLPGFEPAVVQLPAGKGPFAVAVVAHGAGGTAEQHLGQYSATLGQRMILACPRGRRLRSAEPGAGYYYENHHRLQDEVLALVDALRNESDTALKGMVSAPPWLYVGYSQGATMGVLMLLEHASVFDRLLLVEGGVDGWTYARMQRFRNDGGRRVLWVCGTQSCSGAAQRAAALVERAEIAARTVYVSGGGHAYWGKVGDAVADELQWLLLP